MRATFTLILLTFLSSFSLVAVKAQDEPEAPVEAREAPSAESPEDAEQAPPAEAAEPPVAAEAEESPAAEPEPPTATQAGAEAGQPTAPEEPSQTPSSAAPATPNAAANPAAAASGEDVRAASGRRRLRTRRARRDEDGALELPEPGEFELTEVPRPFEEQAAAPEATSDEPEEELIFKLTTDGSYNLHLNGLSDIPLASAPTGELEPFGQNYWVGQWFRLEFDFQYRDWLKAKIEFDMLNGMVFGDFSEGVSAAERPRESASSLEYLGFRPRQAYIELTPDFGLIRAGLMTFNWGLGILANDGNHEQPFGDYRYGDRVFRLMLAVQPLGKSTPFFTAFAGDVVLNDLNADLLEGDLAVQGVLTAFYQDGMNPKRRIGGYVAYRHQERTSESGGPAGPLPITDLLDVFAANFFFTWSDIEPSGGELFIAFEAATILGNTTFARTTELEQHTVAQLMGALQVGRRDEDFDITLEAGYTSGDSNALDDVQSRATMDPDHRVGLLLFPEVLAWQSARTAGLAGDPSLVGRPPPGTELLPTNGGVSGAVYFFPNAAFHLLPELELRAGAVIGYASSQVTDPWRQRALSTNASHLGGDPDARDLGIELDFAVRLDLPISGDYRFKLIGEGAVLFPGTAFTAMGASRDPMGMARIRASLVF